MTLTQLKQKLIYYFQQTSLSPAFMQDSDDMLLSALNSARKSAELAYAFELNKKTLRAPSVTGSFEWGSLVEDGGVTSYAVRTVKNLWRVSADSGVEELPLEYSNLVPRMGLKEAKRKAFLVGTKIHVLPALAAEAVIVDAYVWMPEYTAYSQTDWMVQHGWEYLFWACVHDLNMRFKEFVPRQEGNLTISETMVEKKLAALIAYDAQLKHGAFNLAE